MKRFNYTLNHKADEAYMKKMCDQGWATKSLVEGIWTFEPCKPGQYVYRVAYLRGKSKDEICALKTSLEKEGIEYVSRYSFWAIFRCEHDFELYKGKEELKICEKIRRPMPYGAIISGIVCVWLIVKANGLFMILGILFGIYALVCACLAISYTRLIHEIKSK